MTYRRWLYVLACRKDDRRSCNLANSRVWLFHGDKDIGVPKSTMQELRNFYQLMGVPAANIAVKDGPDAKHGMPIKALPSGDSGRHCKLPDPSFLVRCDYGAAELLLRHLYPDASPASGSSSGSGRIVGFDQTEFFDETERSTSLHEFGYLYVPAACENRSESGAKCRLHVAFHGCEQDVGKSTTSSFETPDTMTGPTPTTSSFFTPKPRHGCVWQI